MSYFRLLRQDIYGMPASLEPDPNPILWSRLHRHTPEAVPALTVASQHAGIKRLVRCLDQDPYCGWPFLVIALPSLMDDCPAPATSCA